jgi:hypothetical protein
MIGPALRRNLSFVAAMSVGARRHPGLDEEAIRRESMAVARASSLSTLISINPGACDA